MTAQRRYDLLINQSEAVGFDDCKLRVVAKVAAATAEVVAAGADRGGPDPKRSNRVSFMISVRLQITFSNRPAGNQSGELSDFLA